MLTPWQRKPPYYATAIMVEPWVGWSICTLDGVAGPFASYEAAEEARQNLIAAKGEGQDND